MRGNTISCLSVSYVNSWHCSVWVAHVKLFRPQGTAKEEINAIWTVWSVIPHSNVSSPYPREDRAYTRHAIILGFRTKDSRLRSCIFDWLANIHSSVSLALRARPLRLLRREPSNLALAGPPRPIHNLQVKLGPLLLTPYPPLSLLILKINYSF